MICLNRVQLLGYAGSRETYKNNNFEVVNFTLATNYRYKKGEEFIEETTWFNCVYFNPPQFITEGLTKGARLYCEGRMKTEEYEHNGEKRKAWKVIVEKLILLPKEQNTDLDRSPEELRQEEHPADNTQPAEAPRNNGSIPGIGAGRRKTKNNNPEDLKDYYDVSKPISPSEIGKDDDLPF